MKKIKYVKLLCVLTVVLAAASQVSADTLLGSWDMSGTPVTKTVDSVMATLGYPSGGFVSESRTVLEYDDGDIVYGWPKESPTVFPAQSADGLGASGQAGDVSMLFEGALKPSAYIGEIFRSVTTAFKVEYDFKLFEPENWANATTTTTMLAGGLNRFDMRLATLAGPVAKVQMYCYKATGGATLVETAYTVNMTGWNHVVFWLQNGVMNIKLNDDAVVSVPLGAAFVTVNELQYDGLTLGARFDGNGRWARIYMDNLALYTMVDGCGSWGYLPTDFNEDCVVDMEDLETFVAQWLVCTDPQGTGCIDVLAQ